MKQELKKYLPLFAVILVFGIGVLFFGGETDLRKDDRLVSESTLTPELSISHGHGLAVDVADQNKVYIATHYGLLVLVNEKELYRIGKSRDDYMGFSPHSADANIFFTSGHPSTGGNMGFQKSEDGGVTWGKVSDGANGPVDFHALTISPVNLNLVYGWYRGELQRSANQGKSWEVVNQKIQPFSLVADTQDENTVYAATIHGAMISHDKGVNFTSLSKELDGGEVSVIAVHPKDSKILLAFSKKLGGLGKSIDNGATWKKIAEGWSGGSVLHIAFNGSNPNIVYALTSESVLYKSNDTGDTWSKIR